jgi:hypothetical protein
MIPKQQTENYNETVLIPILQNKVNELVTQTIVLEAKLQIAQKENAALENRLGEVATSLQALQAAQALQPTPTGEQNPD